MSGLRVKFLRLALIENDRVDLWKLPDLEQVNRRRKADNHETRRREIAGSYGARLLAGDNGAR
jgi:hypothetical protein